MRIGKINGEDLEDRLLLGWRVVHESEKAAGVCRAKVSAFEKSPLRIDHV
jgi:hypothetical protein